MTTIADQFDPMGVTKAKLGKRSYLATALQSVSAWRSYFEKLLN